MALGRSRRLWSSFAPWVSIASPAALMSLSESPRSRARTPLDDRHPGVARALPADVDGDAAPEHDHDGDERAGLLDERGDGEGHEHDQRRGEGDEEDREAGAGVVAGAEVADGDEGEHQQRDGAADRRDGVEI